MGKILGIIHTTPVTVKNLSELAKNILGDVKVINVLDDSLLEEVMRFGGVTPGVHKRMALHSFSLQDAGADLILDACSSVGEVVERTEPFLQIPIVRIDKAMAVEALSIGRRVGVIATVQTTLEPTARLLERQALDGQEEVRVNRVLCKGAYEALINGEPELHDEIVKKELTKLYNQKLDVIVLAQASMARIVADLPPASTPILSSPKPAMESLKKMLEI